LGIFLSNILKGVDFKLFFNEFTTEFLIRKVKRLIFTSFQTFFNLINNTNILIGYFVVYFYLF